jgi:hypothetical protein
MANAFGILIEITLCAAAIALLEHLGYRIVQPR